MVLLAIITLSNDDLNISFNQNYPYNGFLTDENRLILFPSGPPWSISIVRRTGSKSFFKVSRTVDIEVSCRRILWNSFSSEVIPTIYSRIKSENVMESYALTNGSFDSNTTTLGPDSCNGQPNCTTHPVGVLILLEMTGEVLIAILAIVGNGFVLVAIATASSLQTVTNFYVASLAAADLLVGLLGIPCVIVAFNGLPTNFFGCLIVNSCIIVLTQISIFGLFIVALERFYAIRYPYYYCRHCTTKSTIAAIAITWTAGIIVGMVPIFGWNKGKMEAYEDGAVCTFTAVIDYEYMVYMNFFGFVVPPLLAMFAVYGYIYTVVRKQIRKIYTLQLATSSVIQNPSSVSGSNSSHATVSTVSKRVEDSQRVSGTEVRLKELEPSGNGTDVAEPSDVGGTEKLNGSGKKTTRISDSSNGLSMTKPKKEPTTNGTAEKKPTKSLLRQRVASTVPADSNAATAARKSVSSWKREIRAAKWFAVVLSVFTACWLPLHIQNCVTLFGGPTCLPCVTSAVILSHLNSAVNPILYAYSNSKFAAAFRRMLRLRGSAAGTTSDSMCMTDRGR